MIIYCPNDNNLIKNYIKFIKFLKEIKNRINIEFKYSYYLKVKLEFQKENEKNIDYTYNISCIYTFFEPEENQESKFKEDNILVNFISSYSQAFPSLISEMNDEKYEYILFCNGDFDIYNDSNSRILEDSLFSENLSNSYFLKYTEDYKIFGKYIKGLKNEYFISWGYESNKIYIYDKYFQQQLLINRLKNLRSHIIDIIEINNDEKQNEEIQLFISTKAKFFLIDLDLKTFNYKTKVDLDLFKLKIIKHIKNKKYNNLFLLQNGNIYSLGTYLKSIKINKDVVLFLYESISKEQKEKDKLLFFNLSKKEVIQEIVIGTFSKFPNNLVCIENEKRKSKNKVLLCACKNLNHENGIILININFEKPPIKTSFYIQNFNINCICPITTNLSNEIYINKKDDVIIFTKYLLVAGIENNNNTIKLFKLLFTNNIDNNFIEYDRDIEVKILERIKAPITCLFQFKKDGRLILISEDGFVFYFTI